ncbi:MAG: glycosyltransferase [Acidimicrobiia bacterium]
MRICFVAPSSIRRDPKAVAQANSTLAAGHELVGISRDAQDLPWVSTIARASLSDRMSRRGLAERIVRSAKQLKADLYIPTGPAALGIAEQAAHESATFLAEPSWDESANRLGLIWRAPSEPSLSLPAGGEMPIFHVPSYQPSVVSISDPVHIVYRRTERNPGRYLEEALRRRGIDTTHAEEIAWDSVSPKTLGVVVVESPLPALPVHGSNPGTPVVFWVHHGEHHLDANLRLQRLYGAHAVALAHSWHLAYRFSGLVDRLPFGVAAELGRRDFVAHNARRFDVAFVGSSGWGQRYRRRIESLEAIKTELGDEQVAVASDLSPEEMTRLYRDSRIVPDDGAGRHLPVTMRVFEAAGAGALLVTREGPGLELLFHRDEEFVAMSSDGARQVIELAGRNTETVGKAAHARAWSHHTYDRRVDDLLALFTRLRDLDLETPRNEASLPGPAGAVTGFADAQRILNLEGDLDDHLSDREVWQYTDAADRAEPNTFHVAVIAGGSPNERRRAVAAARTAVVTEPGLATEIGALVTDEHGDHRTVRRGGTVVFTFGEFGYRMSNAPDPRPPG